MFPINGSLEMVTFTVDLIVEDFKFHLITFLSSRSSLFLVLTFMCLALITNHQKQLEKFQVVHLNDRDCLLPLVSIPSEDILQMPGRKLLTFHSPKLSQMLPPK